MTALELLRDAAFRVQRTHDAICDGETDLALQITGDLAADLRDSIAVLEQDNGGGQ